MIADAADSTDCARFSPQVNTAGAAAVAFESEAAAVRSRIASELRTLELVAILRRAEGVATADLQVRCRAALIVCADMQRLSMCVGVFRIRI